MDQPLGKTPYEEITETIDAVVDAEAPEQSPPTDANVYYTLTVAKLYEARIYLLKAQEAERIQHGING